MRKLSFLLVMLLLTSAQLLAQRTITGKVTGAEDGSPIPGVTVQVKGTSLVGLTDIDGKYAISSVPKTATTLQFTYVGMKPLEVALGAATNYDVALETTAKEIEGVVVTALGISRDKKSLGYAVQDVKSDELVRAGSSNAVSAMAGKVAGVQINTPGAIGSSSRIVIRGNSSLGNNQPLIVVDGIPISNSSAKTGAADYGSGLYDINPQDIESMTILKGGAAAALYGMRAGNGVILITTKSGKKSKGISLEYDGNFNIDQVYSIQKLQNKYGQGYLGDEWIYKQAKEDGYKGSYQEFALGGYDPGYGFKYVDGIGNGVNDGVDESWGPRLDIGLKIPQYNSPIKDGVRQATDWISRPNNIRSFFQLGRTMNHNISLTSSTENTTTRFSLGYRNQTGVMPNTDMKYYTVAVNSLMKLSKMFHYDIAVNYTRKASDNIPTGEYNASNPMESMGQWFGRQIDLADLKAHWTETMENGFPYNWNSNYHNNPYWSMNKNTNSYQRDRIFGKTSLYFMPIAHLKFEGRLGMDYYNSQYDRIWTTRSNETLLDAATATFSGGQFRTGQERNTEFNSDIIGTYDQRFGKFSLNLLAGANYRNLRWQNNVTGADDLTVPDLFTISNAKGAPVNAVSHSWIRSNSIYSSLSLGFNDFAYLDASWRKDWSSTLKTPFSYPALSLSFLPLEALKFDNDILSYLKIRAGWAKVGNATSAYRIDPYFSVASPAINGVTQYLQASEFPPAGLKPEQVVTKELGFEAAFLKNRIKLDVAVYNKTTTDQIMSVAVSKASGYNTTLVNAGKFTNKGIELQLRGDILKSDNGLNWNMTINWAKDNSKIVELYTDPVTQQKVESYQIGSQWSVTTQARPGEAWGVIYGTGMVRRTADGAVIVGANGLPTRQANMRLGNVTPDWMGGIRNELTYKNVSLGFLLDMRMGGDIFSVSQMFGAYGGQLAFTADKDFRENGLVLGKDFLTNTKFVKITKKDATDIQKSEFAENDIRVGAQDFFESYYANRELSIYKGSFLKLREAYLSYSLPKKLFNNNFIQGGTISLVGSNLAILWRDKSNLSGIDPENTVGSGNDGVGLETTSIPPTRSIGIKLNLKF